VICQIGITLETAIHLILKTFNMANMKNGLSYFEDGGEVQTPAAPLSKPIAPKGRYGVASPIGAVPMNESVLENMQKLLEQKQAQQGSFAERLKDVKSVFTGSGATQAQAMDTRNKQRLEQSADIFQMQNQLAQQKAAQAQLANIRAEDEKSGWGRPQAGGAPTPGTVAPGASPTPVAGAPETDIVQQYNRILYTQGIEAANRFKNDYLKEKSKASFNPNLDPIVKFPVGNQMVDMPLSYAQRMAKNNPQLQMYLEKVTPGATSNAPAAAPSAANAPAVATPVAPSAAPTAPVAPKPPVSAAPAAPTPIRAPSAVVGGPLPSSTDITQRMEIEKAEALAGVKGREKEFEKIGENAGKQVEYIESALSNSTADLAAYDKLNTLVTNNPLAFGVLQNPGILSGALKAVQEGANVGNYNVNIPGVETLVRQAGGTKDDITAANMAIREFAKLQLNAAKLLQGQGSVSDAERRLLSQVAGSASDDPRTIKDMIKWGKARAEYDREMGEAWKGFLKKNPNGSYREFYINSPERNRISEGWKKKTEELLKDYESLGKKPVSGARAEINKRKEAKKKQEGF
jgi:hypothetical protein